MRTHPSLDALIHDLRFGLRNLARNPGFTLVALLSLSLGIASTSAMYSVIHAVVLDPFPYKEVDSLMSVRVWSPEQRGGRTWYTTDQFLEIAERNSIFEGTIASTISDVLWSGDGDPQRLRGNYCPANTFEVMGVPPLIGRALTPADWTSDAPPVVVLGYRFWQRQFGGEPNILGRPMRLNNKVRSVVGVMPKRFMWRGADVYVPIVFRRGEIAEGVRYVHLLGRLRSGVTEAQAEADLRPIIEDLRERDPNEFPEKWRVGLLSFKETFPSAIRAELWILFGAVALLLFIACANVSNLLIARAAGRQREMAVRASLGAGRARLVRQLLTESLMLALAGGALGVLLGVGGLQAIVAVVPPDTIPDESEIALNTPVLLFSLAVSVLTALLFGLAPAISSSSTHPADSLKAAGRGMTGSPRQSLLRNALVVAEVALALLLLISASLMLRTLLAMQSVEIGVAAERILTMRIPLSEQRYPDRARRVAFFDELLHRLGEIPAIAAAGVNTGLHPLGNWNAPVEVPGSPSQDARPVVLHQVSRDYIRTMGIPVLEGRLFDEREIAGKQPLAVVNEAFVKRYLPDAEPLGREVRIPRLRNAPASLDVDAFQIIGIVKDTRNRGLRNEAEPELFFPYSIAGMTDTLAVLSHGNPAALTRTIQAQIQAIDKDQPVTNVRTLERLLGEWVFARPRFNLILFSVFAVLGLALAVIGIYGVISNSVSQRTREIGVRIALGATSANVVGMVISGCLKLLGAGIALGLTAGVAAARLLSQQVWNVSVLDPLPLAAVSMILLIVGLLACLRPARRASRVDPATALRWE